MSNTISEEDLKIETDRYWDEEEKRVEIVKLTMISTNLDVTFCSYKGQLDAYNRALRKLETRYKEWLLEEQLNSQFITNARKDGEIY